MDDGHRRPRARTPLADSRFYRIGAFAVRRRRRVIAAWLIVLVAMFPLIGKLTARLSQGGFEVPGSQSDIVKKTIDRDFRSQFDFTEVLVIHDDRLTATDPSFQALIARETQALRTAPGVAAVLPPLTSADGHTTTVTLGLSDTQDEALRHADTLNALVARAKGSSGITALLTGAPQFYSEFSHTTTHDLERAEKIAFPITLLILVLAFGSLVAAGLPLILALFGLMVSFGIISAIAATTTVSIFTQNIASMIGIGVGIDYSLFIVSRYRQRLRAGRPVAEAVAESIASSGKAVFVSALTVAVALSGTVLVNIAAFRSMGYGAMITVAIAGTAALTLLPALLGWIGPRIDALSVRRRAAREHSGESGLWHRWALLVMRRAWIAVAVASVLLVLIALPARNLLLGSSGPSILPPDSGPRIASEITGKAFGEGQVAPVKVVVTDPKGVLTDGFAALCTLVRQRIPALDPSEVVRVDSIASLPGTPAGQTCAEAQAFAQAPLAASLVKPRLAQGNTETLIDVVTRHGAQSDQSNTFVKKLRSSLPKLLPSGVTAVVGGDGGLNVDINQEVSRKLVPVVSMVLVLSFLVLMLFFRSILLPLKAIIMNTLSVLAAYGVLVFVFQEGHFNGLLGFATAGHIESFIPLFLFSILFGLSMDYEVFLLARIREEYLRTGDNTEAVGWGLEHTAGIITSAAAVMVTVFGAFVFASLVPIKEMGLGLATAVFLDATIIRVVLVPATMRLLGKWNWWLPGWIDRRLPNVSLEGLPKEEQPAVEPAVPTPI